MQLGPERCQVLDSQTATEPAGAASTFSRFGEVSLDFVVVGKGGAVGRFVGVSPLGGHEGVDVSAKRVKLIAGQDVFKDDVAVLP